MEQVAIRTLNQHTTEVVARVERGEVVEITAGVVQPPTITGPVPMPAAAAEPGTEAGELVSLMRDEESS